MQDVDIGKFSRAIGFRKTTTSIRSVEWLKNAGKARKGCISGWALDDEKLYAVCTVKKGVFPYQPPFLIKGKLFNKFGTRFQQKVLMVRCQRGQSGEKKSKGC